MNNKHCPKTERVVLIIRFMRITACMLALLLLLPKTSATANQTPLVQAKSAILLTADGQCLFEKDADTRMLIASTTKLMTALVSLEQSSLNRLVTVKPAHCAVEGSSMGLKAGERYSVQELLTGLLLASGNDAALALADAVGGSEAGFVRLMNQKAEQLELDHTHFANPHGLDAEKHYSTARDLAKLMCACMENKAFCKLSGIVSTEIHGTAYLNHNKLLTRYPGCIGGKTGYTRAAGRCLVTCCEKNDLRLICVTLSDPDDWHDQSALYDWAYANFRWLKLNDVCYYEVPVVSGSPEKLTVLPPEDVKVLIPAEEEVIIRAELPQFIFAPVKPRDVAGGVSILLQNRVLAEFPLYFTQGAVMTYPVFQPVPAEKGNPWPNESKNSYRKQG